MLARAPLYHFTLPDGSEAQASYTLAKDGEATIHEVLNAEGLAVELTDDEIELLLLDIELEAVLSTLGMSRDQSERYDGLARPGQAGLGMARHGKARSYHE